MLPTNEEIVELVKTTERLLSRVLNRAEAIDLVTTHFHIPVSRAAMLVTSAFAYSSTY